MEHTLGAFYEAFPPEEAKRLIDRFEFVFTPKHGGSVRRDTGQSFFHAQKINMFVELRGFEYLCGRKIRKNKMTIQELKRLRESEDKVEFKEAKTQFSYNSGKKSVLGYVAAFANEGGGYLVWV